MLCPICTREVRMETTCYVCSRVICGINCSSGRLDVPGPNVPIWCQECRTKARKAEAEQQPPKEK